MRADEQGFVYPEIDLNKCINCGLCDKVCPFKHTGTKQGFEQKIFGVRLKNKTNLSASQSGGAFQAIARQVICNGGIVYGVALAKDLSIRHYRITKIENLPQIYGSKYVQSDLNGIYNKVITDLRNDKNVLFSGVGCQVAGLISLCKLKHVPTEKLIAVDLICYGVPSPSYWRDYINYLHNKYKSPIIRFLFRDKKACGWNLSQSSFTLADGRKIFPTRNFYNTLLFRRSCSECPFTSFNRISDITIGDYWGIEKIRPDWAIEDTGASLILVNTYKGKHVIDTILPHVEYFESNQEECRQPQLLAPNPLNPLKDEWEHYYQKYGFQAAARKFDIILPQTLFKKTLQRLRRIIKQITRL